MESNNISFRLWHAGHRIGLVYFQQVQKGGHDIDRVTELVTQSPVHAQPRRPTQDKGIAHTTAMGILFVPF